ncbi:hypothetical protein Nmel_003222 [Mimus melanotis]
MKRTKSSSTHPLEFHKEPHRNVIFGAAVMDKWGGKKVSGHLYVKSHLAGHLTPM